MKRRGREIPLGKEVFDLDLNSLPVEIADATSASNVGLNRAPIDVDAIEDEVQLLSSSRGVPQVRSLISIVFILCNCGCETCSDYAKF